MASIIAMPSTTLAVRVMRPDRDGADEGGGPPEDKHGTPGSPDGGNSSSLSFTQEQEEELTQTDEESGVDLMSSAEEQSGEDLMRSLYSMATQSGEDLMQSGEDLILSMSFIAWQLGDGDRV